jgi:ribosomal protein S18 acetylase RimI-like enzyme
MVAIRPLRDADIDAVAAVHVRTWQVAYAGLVPAEHLDRLDPAVFAERRRRRSPVPGAHTVVADDEGVVIGFAAYGPYRAEHGEPDEPAAGELYAVYVDPGRWGAGAGRDLLGRARTDLSAAGFREMRLWVLEGNGRARRFYERAGLRPDGVRDTYTPRGTTAELPEIRYTVRL